MLACFFPHLLYAMPLFQLLLVFCCSIFVTGSPSSLSILQEINKEIPITCRQAPHVLPHNVLSGLLPLSIYLNCFRPWLDSPIRRHTRPPTSTPIQFQRCGGVTLDVVIAVQVEVETVFGVLSGRSAMRSWLYASPSPVRPDPSF
jgi:hypothetical protein